MKDIRNIVIGLLAVGVVWSWAAGQQRRTETPNLGVGVYVPFEADISTIGRPGQPASGGERNLFRMNTGTGQIEMMTILADGNSIGVSIKPIPPVR